MAVLRSGIGRRGRSRVIAAGAVALTAAAARAVLRVEVTGDSMRPTLLPGDRLLVVRHRRVRPGDLVAVRDPREATRLLVKRAAAVDGTGVRVVGDNPARSTDSRTFGPVAPGAVLGRVVYRYSPVARAGPLRRA